MDWTLLGIVPTKDKQAIAAAYRKQLAHANPEDKPEEFKRLRGAYEEALRLAQEDEVQEERDESPVGLWMERARALYQDYSARIRLESWEALLSDPVCIALDQRSLARDALLRFFLEDYFVPQEVWQLLDQTFSLREQREELYERFPRDFVDYAVINGIRFPTQLPYGLFVPGKDGKACDDYRRLYYRIGQSSLEEMGPLLEQLADMPEWHPYGEGLTHRMELALGETEKARAGLRSLAQAYPREAPLVLNWAIQCQEMGKFAECEALTRRVLSLQPESWLAKRTLAESLAAQERYEEAKEHLYDLMHAAAGDQKKARELSQQIRQWNETLIRQGEARLAQDPRDDKQAMSLAWCYLQNEDPEAALRICQGIPQDYEDRYDYHNLCAKIRYAQRDYEAALNHLLTLEDILRNLRPDGTEERDKRLRRLPEFMQMAGSCLRQLGREEEALKKFEDALALAPQEPEILNQMSLLLFYRRDFDRAVEVLETLTRVLPSGYHGFMLLAMCLYEIKRDRDAFEAVNRALNLEGGDLGVYEVKMRILLRNGLWPQVREILDFLHTHGVENPPGVAWCEAQLLELEKKDAQGALEAYQALARRLENGEELYWGSQVYYRIVWLLGDQRDARKPEDRAELMEIVEKGLALDPHDADCIDYKAWLLKRDKQFDKALELYHQLEARPHHSISVELALGELYYRILSKHADKALHYYELVLARNERGDFHFFAATCCRFLGDYAGAEAHYLREQEIEPEDVDGYNGLAYTYEALGRWEEALEQMEKAVALVADRERDYAWLYSHKVQILRRLKRPQEALDTVDEAMKRYDYEDGYSDKFDICCQHGMWVQACKVLSAWKKSGKAAKQAAAAEVRMDIYLDEWKRARHTVTKKEWSLEDGDLEDLRLQIAELDGDLPCQKEIWKKRLKEKRDITRGMLDLAEVLWRMGDRESARKFAGDALERLDAILRNHLVDGTMYRCRRVLALAILGREAEARAALDAVRQLPLCERCSYCACKDADIYAVAMEEFLGDEAEALALAKEHAEKWPDELDFVSARAHLERKGTGL